MNNRKNLLDSILIANQTDIVGNGYIDIIVSRSNFISLIATLVNEDFRITNVAWWEYCSANSKNSYGMGGIKSKHYDGWYSELPINLDEIMLYDLVTDKSEFIQGIVSIIERKEIKFPDENIKFRTSNWLTPALWLDVPKDWKNVQDG